MEQSSNNVEKKKKKPEKMWIDCMAGWFAEGLVAVKMIDEQERHRILHVEVEMFETMVFSVENNNFR